MSNEFRREDRYIVIKNTDADKASPETRRAFSVACRKLHDSMLTRGAPARSFLVIESDWPEYEPTWAAIEARVTGAAPQPSALGGEPNCAHRFMSLADDPRRCADCNEIEPLAFAVFTKTGNMRVWSTSCTAVGLKASAEEGSPIIGLIDRAHLAPLQAEIERLNKLHDLDTEMMRRMSAEDDQLKARCDELEGLLREVVALDPRGEFMGWQLDGRIDAALPKPAGSDTTLTGFGPEHTWTCGTCQNEQPTDRACDVCNGSTEPAPRECCTPTTDEQAWLAAGDCTPEELWGGPRPTCPKCIGSVKP